MRLLVACPDGSLRSRITKMVARRGHVVAPVTGADAINLGKADALVALVTAQEREDPTTYFAIGFAKGRDIPTLILTEGSGHGTLLPDATPIFGGFENFNALSFHLETFVGSLSSPPKSATLPSSPVDARSLRSELADIRGIEQPAQSSALFEQLVEHLLRSGGAQVAPAPYRAKAGFDLAASIPGLTADTGAVLVECKRLRSRAGIQKAADRLQMAVLDRGGVLGILVYDDELLPSKQGWRPVPLVIQVGIDELIEQTSRSGLGPALVAAREEAIEEL